MWEEKREGSNDESSHSKHKRKETQLSIIKEKHSSYTPPTNQVWEENEEGSKDESSYPKHKMKETQNSIIKEKHSRCIPPNNQGWEETQVSIIKEKHSKCTPTIIRVGRRKKRAVMTKAAIQNTK